MTYDLTDEVKYIGSLNFEGNIIPIEWFSEVRLPNNKPDLVSIILLSDIIYWYRPSIIRDELSGKVLSYKKKFKSDLLQKGYKELEELFGFSSKQIREAFIRLEGLGLIKRIFRTIESKGAKLSNVMFIKIFPNKIVEITSHNPISLQANSSFPTGKHLLPHMEIPLSPHGNTYTETTTQITTKNSFSSKSEGISKELNIKSLYSNDKYEREKEMINIWDKVIREGDKPSVHNKSRLSALKKVLKEYFEDNLENWESYCLNIKNSNFLMGGGANNWKADLTWATRQDNLIRVIEGYYRQKEEKEFKNNISEELQEEDDVVSNDPIWNKVIELLKSLKGEATYKSWFRKLSVEGYEEDKALLIAPSKFIKDWILSHFKDDIINSFKQTNSNIRDIEIFTKNEEGILV